MIARDRTRKAAADAVLKYNCLNDRVSSNLALRFLADVEGLTGESSYRTLEILDVNYLRWIIVKKKLDHNPH